MLHWMPSLSTLHPQLPPTNPPTHSTPEAQRLCVCVCGGSEKEREKKQGVELQHSVLFISTVSHGTLGKWNVCSSGWLQHWLRFDWSWMLRTEHITELKGRRPVRNQIGFWVLFSIYCFLSRRILYFSKEPQEVLHVKCLLCKLAW